MLKTTSLPIQGQEATRNFVIALAGTHWQLAGKDGNKS